MALLKIPDSEYFAINRVSKSELDKLNRAPAVLKDWKDNERTLEGKAIEFGTWLHCALLEPKLFAKSYVRAPEGLDMRTKVGKAAMAKVEEEHAGKEVIPGWAFTNLMHITSKVNQSKLFKSLVNEKSMIEQAFTWVDPDLLAECKGKADVISGSILLDVKSTKSAQSDDFAKSIDNFRYHVQGAFYRDGLAANNIKIDRFIMLAIETEPPFLFTFYELSGADLEFGRLTYKADLALYMECKHKDFWPGLSQEIRLIERPTWARSRDSKIFSK